MHQSYNTCYKFASLISSCNKGKLMIQFNTQVFSGKGMTITSFNLCCFHGSMQIDYLRLEKYNEFLHLETISSTGKKKAD